MNDDTQHPQGTPQPEVDSGQVDHTPVDIDRESMTDPRDRTNVVIDQRTGEVVHVDRVGSRSAHWIPLFSDPSTLTYNEPTRPARPGEVERQFRRLYDRMRGRK